MAADDTSPLWIKESDCAFAFAEANRSRVGNDPAPGIAMLPDGVVLPNAIYDVDDANDPASLVFFRHSNAPLGFAEFNDVKCQICFAR